MTIEKRQKCLVTESDIFSAAPSSRVSFERMGDNVCIDMPDWQDRGDDATPWITVPLADLRAAVEHLEQGA